MVFASLEDHDWVTNLDLDLLVGGRNHLQTETACVGRPCVNIAVLPQILRNVSK